MDENRIHESHKRNRLEGYDYGSEGVYFLTLCTEGRRNLLSRIVARGILDAPETELTSYGKVLKEAIDYLNQARENICVEEYVIMPNHLHILVRITKACKGASGMPRATDAVIPRFVSFLKRYTNRTSGKQLWQTSYYDHIIRSEADFWKHLRYIEENPAKWLEDQYYREEAP
ncbi:MAG: transposase [Faecousia sp.]